MPSRLISPRGRPSFKNYETSAALVAAQAADILAGGDGNFGPMVQVDGVVWYWKGDTYHEIGGIPSVIFQNTESGSFSVTGSGSDSFLVQDPDFDRGSLTHDVTPIFRTGKSIVFEFYGSGLSNSTPQTHNSSWQLSGPDLSISANSLTLQTSILAANEPFRWKSRARVFSRSVPAAPANVRRVCALLEYERTASYSVIVPPSTAVEFGIIDVDEPNVVTWGCGLVEGSAGLPHDMVVDFSRIAVSD